MADLSQLTTDELMLYSQALILRTLDAMAVSENIAFVVPRDLLAVAAALEQHMLSKPDPFEEKSNE